MFVLDHLPSQSYDIISRLTDWVADSKWKLLFTCSIQHKSTNSEMPLLRFLVLHKKSPTDWKKISHVSCFFFVLSDQLFSVNFTVRLESPASRSDEHRGNERRKVLKKTSLTDLIPSLSLALGRRMHRGKLFKIIIITLALPLSMLCLTVYSMREVEEKDRGFSC